MTAGTGSTITVGKVATTIGTNTIAGMVRKIAVAIGKDTIVTIIGKRTIISTGTTATAIGTTATDDGSLHAHFLFFTSLTLQRP
ncbi:hypothetical protein GCM10027172_16220 [Halomonas garicola]